MEKNMIHIIDSDDNELDVELISILENNNKKYLIYTKEEKQDDDNIIIYISKLKIKDGKYILKDIRDEEWSMVKKLLSNIINK